MAKEMLHEDFGEKIGGAKKDLWGARGLYSYDLEEMNSREADKYVKKDNIWKKPDYQAMIAAGKPVDLVYFLKVVRDSLNAVPRYYRTDDTPEKRLARQKEYIETIREIQAAIEKVQSVEDALQAFDTCMIRGGYFERKPYGISGVSLVPTKKGSDNPTITDKLVKALYFRSERDFERKIVREAIKKQFGVPAEQKVPRGYEIHFNDGKNTYSAKNDWLPNTYYVTRGHFIIQKNFPDRASALQWVQEFAKQRGGNGKKRFVPQQLAKVRRTGPNYRNGRDVVGQDYLDAFAFRGGEFGNWMTQNDRRASLNMGFEALKDLAAALQISEKDISYQGTLSIAFGARGSGNAAAHYEPLRKVINLTKMHGAGALAHEWWHGLDDYLGGKFGANGYLSENTHLYAPFNKLVEVMKYKPETLEQATARTAEKESATRKNIEKSLDYSILTHIKRSGDEKIVSEYEHLKSDFFAGVPGTLDRLNALKKSVTGHVIPKNDRTPLEVYERVYQQMATEPPQPPQIGKVKTDYYRGSIEMGEICEKDGGYWQSNVEMTARAFATYVMDKLPYRSDYLDGHAEHALAPNVDKDGNIHMVYAYPRGEERAAINAVFDEIIEDLKRENILTHSDHPEPLPEIYPAEIKHTAFADPMPVITGAEQLSLFGSEKPSVLAQLAGARHHPKEVVDPAPKKSVPEL
ncbi:hypothetical protein CE91St36_01010 [Christensenellaceae bacterium]|nr:hypothetical protein CE91St36_01010 [Christensenellaceae bacterium]BDF59951.1 hypothetical protein CE91St37_01010 [Christensenellaceae bacterium]